MSAHLIALWFLSLIAMFPSSAGIVFLENKILKVISGVLLTIFFYCFIYGMFSIGDSFVDLTQVNDRATVINTFKNIEDCENVKNLMENKERFICLTRK